ncbi:hypothetical protein RclHR1_19630003 [Rhizophagus clarus]|uniref:Uncharacterized protein n=1 Tax=Rhizophagus clarus TaxID=94130 RepID=A0A2Z6R250_9GLOM|nr:hypothetical protein RclHR1_19630003 [Rhizophagus clarus]
MKVTNSSALLDTTSNSCGISVKYQPFLVSSLTKHFLTFRSISVDFFGCGTDIGLSETALSGTLEYDLTEKRITVL